MIDTLIAWLFRNSTLCSNFVCCSCMSSFFDQLFRSESICDEIRVLHRLWCRSWCFSFWWLSFISSSQLIDFEIISSSLDARFHLMKIRWNNNYWDEITEMRLLRWDYWDEITEMRLLRWDYWDEITEMRLLRWDYWDE